MAISSRCRNGVAKRSCHIKITREIGLPIQYRLTSVSPCTRSIHRHRKSLGCFLGDYYTMIKPEEKLTRWRSAMFEQLGILPKFVISLWKHALTRIYRSSIVIRKAPYQMIVGTTGSEFCMRIFCSFVHDLACSDTLISIVCWFQTTNHTIMQFSPIHSAFNS